MWTHQSPGLVLASASPRRFDLLNQIAVPLEQLVLPAHADDEPRLAHETVVDYVQRTSLEKNLNARAYIKDHRPDLVGWPVLSADTTVALDQTILGKPSDAGAAKMALHSLIGKAHDVYTAVTLHANGAISTALVHSTVEIDQSLEAALDDYVESGEPFGKAGSYGIQGKAAAYIRSLTGSYSAVVGLPLFETAQLLRKAGLYK